MTYDPGSYEPRREPLGQPAAPVNPPAPPQAPPYPPTAPLPAQYPPPYGYQQPWRGWPPPPPANKGMPAWEIVLIVVGSVVGLLIIVGVTVSTLGGSIGGGSGGSKSPTYDVISCSYDGFATTLTYELRNNDTKTHDYIIEGTVGHSPTIPDVLKNVAPGERATGKMIGTEQGGCAITRVNQQ